MTADEAREIAEFAVMAKEFRGWTFSMREDVSDTDCEWRKIERLLKKIVRRRAVKTKKAVKRGR